MAKGLGSWLYRALPAGIRARLPHSKAYRRIVNSPDRKILTDEILPVFAQLAGSMLWVGVRRYTLEYPPILEQGGAQVWTCDIDKANAVWGRRGRHVTGDLLEIDQAFADRQFSAVLCNGVFGFGVDTPAMQAIAFEAMARILAPGGWLLLGWNTDRTADPLTVPAFSRWFEPAALGALPTRQPVPGTTHVYDLARLKPGA